ncbi:MAG: NAD(P)/FAD-dependent oxidoreductase [Vicinamibacterales bacterium]
MSEVETADVIIVGSGASGLSAAGALGHVGVKAVALEQDERIGGTWVRRYERLHLHTMRAFSGLAHYAIPRSYPQYVPKDQFAGYLEDYARTMKLDVRLRTHVSQVRPDGVSWRIQAEPQSFGARAVIFATGRYREPITPEWPGMDSFQGRVLHSAAYRSGADFAGQRVLVVGIGNSGAEIAADLAEQGAATVTIAVRTPPPIMPRDLFGLVPAQVLGLLFTPVPAPRLLDRGGAVLRRLGTGDLRRHGLGREAWGPFTSRRPAVIDVGFVRELKAGHITVRPAVDRCTSTGVVFADGQADSFDVIVAATGYRTALDKILRLPEAIAADGRPRFQSGQQTPIPGLFFIGYDETTRGVLYESNRASRRLARVVSRYLKGDH